MSSPEERIVCTARAIRKNKLRAAAFAAGALALLVSSCEPGVVDSNDPPVYRGEIAALLGARCAPCHAGSAPAGGYRVADFPSAVACGADGRRLVDATEGAPLLTVLGDARHVGILGPEELARVRAWVLANAPAARSGVHPAGFVDPRSSERHGAFLRARAYRPLIDTTDADACGRCHAGAPERPRGDLAPAPGAPACTTCHTDGPLGCGTCHGAKDRAYPPRDRCFFPGSGASRAHAAHAEAGPSRAEGLSCDTCHPVPASGRPGGAHATGVVDVRLVAPLAGAQPMFASRDARCTGTCHARGGARPEPRWADTEAPMACGDCHGSPPKDHYVGACTSCHAEADARGTQLVERRLHLNGKVDLGDGSGTCGACHGRATDPTPRDPTHAAHARPSAALPVPCETCHEVPSPADRHPRGAKVDVRLRGLAAAGGRRPTWSSDTKTCAGTYCHEGSGASLPAPSWTSGAPARACTACHGSPPPAPHPASTACGSSGCHEGLVSGDGALTGAGVRAHVNGTLRP